MSARNLGIGFVALVLMGIAALFLGFGTAPPVVSIRAEPLFFIGGFEFTNSMLITLIIDVILLVLAFVVGRNLQMIPTGLQNIMETILEQLYKLFSGISAGQVARTFPIVATIFLFVILANYSGLLPGSESIGMCHAGEVEGEEPVEEGASLDNRDFWETGEIRIASTAPEPLIPLPFLAAAEGESKYLGCQPGDSLIPFLRAPSTDLNFTAALAIISVVWVQYIGFSTLGAGYLTKFFNFKQGIIMFLVGLLELISEIARIPAFMFRLFGNIFAGEVTLVVLIFLLPLGLPIPMYLFEVFVGFIQAFVFAVLTMAFVGTAATAHHDDDH